ncbi:MAG: hypothetical protein H6667_10355 [Ardenticatenaceae bacterium]|nr:hypothetical protein [Ardenticatenaceae bacterium]MCB9446410.1 hypothetical protein [Ardenticatenaceae bacterium]
MMRKVWILLLGLLLAACGGGEADVAPQAESIVCTAAYRSSTEVGIEQEETFTFTDVDDELRATFGEMMFHAAYDAGGADNERNLRVWVTDASASLSTGAAETAVYHSTLFQLETNGGPQNQFVGGHGFTGLNYSYAPDSTAELQYWCAAE